MKKSNLVFLALVVLIGSCVNQKKFTSLRIVYENGAQISPGLELPFGIVAMGKNNKKYITKGYLKGKYSIAKYGIEIEHGHLKEGEAIIVIDSLSDQNLNKKLKLTAWPMKKPELRDSIYIPFNYEGTVTWNFNGENGTDGDDKSARIIPIKVGGTALSDGKPGDTGTSGTAGESLNVYVRKIQDDSFFAHNGFNAFAVTVKTVRGDYSQFTFIAERHGKLILNCNGGNGGKGGDGGRGAHGRDADSEKYAGDGTDGGSGGDGGQGGDGGKVTVYIDSAEKEFLLYLDINNQGGLGGRGGAGGAGGEGGGGYQEKNSGRDGRTGTSGSNGNNGKNGAAPIIVHRD